MKTTLNLPDPLMRRVKIRAASEDRKLKDLIAELLEKGLDAPPTPRLKEGETPFEIDEETGLPVARTLATPGFVPPTHEEFLALIRRVNEEEDLHRAGLLP